GVALGGGEQFQGVPARPPAVPDFGRRVQDDESQVLPGQMPGHGQPGLAAADHDHIQELVARPVDACRLFFARGHRIASLRATVKLNIMPLCMCSAMWQCAIHNPGLDTSNKMSTVCPVRTSTVSFHTRFGSGAPSRASTRKRPAPCRWNGWCMGWSESISLTSRILTRSPTVNRQLIAALAAPVVRSTSIHRMLAGVVSR